MFAPRRILLVAVAGFLFAAGCQSTGFHGVSRSGPTVKPALAVMDFEDRSDFKSPWNLSRELADLLVAELLETRRVTLVERKSSDSVVGEIVRQGQELFGREGRSQEGPPKNARYLVRGTITDFSETAKASGGNARARVAVRVILSDVERGEILSSIKVAESVSASGGGAAVNYKTLSFGGDAFFRTPLGRATRAVVAKTVTRLLRDLPEEPWQPRVAEGGMDEVVINGGANVRVRVGDVFRVREEPREVTDPATGRVIEKTPGKTVARIRVTDVKPESAHAVVLDGAAARGQVLEPVR
jgi:curli biogenesis system outer membrane secretion channel CsgG